MPPKTSSAGRGRTTGWKELLAAYRALDAEVKRHLFAGPSPFGIDLYHAKRFSDLLVVSTRDKSPKEKLAAARRLVEKVYPRLRPRGKRAARVDADKAGVEPRNLILELLVRGIFDAVAVGDQRQFVKRSRTWLIAKGGTLVPKSLPLGDYHRWVLRRAMDYVRDVLDPLERLSKKFPVRYSWFEEEVFAAPREGEDVPWADEALKNAAMARAMIEFGNLARSAGGKAVAKNWRELITKKKSYAEIAREEDIHESTVLRAWERMEKVLARIGKGLV